MKKSKTSIFDRKNRILLKELVKTDFKLRYQGSVLGMLWSVLKPLALFAVMYLVFVHFLKFGAGVPHFAVSLLLAITLWSFFSECTNAGMRAIVDRGNLMRKISIPRYIIVVSTTVSALINLGISLIMVLIFAIINGVDFQWHILLVPLLVIELYVLSLGMAFFLSTLIICTTILLHQPADLKTFGIALGISVIVSAIELISPNGSDNLTIPLSVIILLLWAI